MVGCGIFCVLTILAIAFLFWLPGWQKLWAGLVWFLASVTIAATND